MSDTVKSPFSPVEKVIIDELKTAGYNTFNNVCAVLKTKEVGDKATAPIILESVLRKHFVITGGMFASLIQSASIKDIDIYILDYEGMNEELNALGLPYFKQLILDAKRTYQIGKGHKYSKDKKIVEVFDITNTVFQFMATEHTDRQKLISNFDFKHCTISWHSEILYLTEAAFRAAANKVLVPNNQEHITDYRINKFKERGYRLEHETPQILQSPWTAPLPSGLITPGAGTGVATFPSTTTSTSAKVVSGGSSYVAGALDNDYLSDLEKFLEEQILSQNVAAGSYGGHRQSSIQPYQQQMIEQLVKEQLKSLSLLKDEEDDKRAAKELKELLAEMAKNDQDR